MSSFLDGAVRNQRVAVLNRTTVAELAGWPPLNTHASGLGVFDQRRVLHHLRQGCGGRRYTIGLIHAEQVLGHRVRSFGRPDASMTPFAGACLPSGAGTVPASRDLYEWPRAGSTHGAEKKWSHVRESHERTTASLENPMRNLLRTTSAGCALAIAGFLQVATAQTPAPAPQAATGPAVASPTYTAIPLEIAVNRSAADVWKRVGKFCDIGEWLQIP
jgi:hypothetical protein